MNTSLRGLKLIEQFEGFSAYPYNDGTGVMTIGYGTTSADVSPLPSYLSRAEAEQLLRRKLAEKYEPAVNGLAVPLNQNQYDALVSLAYNVGPGVFNWQIGTDLHNRNYGAAANDFMRYVYAGGRVLQGLVNRRAAERALFLSPVAHPAAPRSLRGKLRFRGELDADTGEWHIHPEPGHNVKLGQHDRVWEAKLGVHETSGQWTIRGIPFA